WSSRVPARGRGGPTPSTPPTTADPRGSEMTRTHDPLTRATAAAALAVALLSLFVSLSDTSPARTQPAGAVAAKAKAKPKKKSKSKAMPLPSLKPKPYGILRLSKAKKFPSSVIPKVAAAKAADTLGGAKREDLALNCPGDTADLGTWCLQT